MPITTYPLNNIEYSAEDAELYNSTRTSGIYASGDFSISVTGLDNLVTIGKGLGWIKNSEFTGKVIAHKNDTVCDVGIPDAYFPRIDAIVIQFDATRSPENATRIIVKKGVASSSPVEPDVVRSEYNYELHLYHILRRPGASSVLASDITDLRMNANYCGLMADSVTRVDTAAIEAQVRGLINRLDAAIAQTQGGTGFMSKTLLWENENPDREFSSQSLPVACANYDGIEIVCHEKVNRGAVWNSGFIPYELGASVNAETISLDDYVGRLRRSFVLLADSIYAENGEFEGLEVGNEQNDVMIPVKIYGYTGIIHAGAEVPPAGQNPGQGEIFFDLEFASYGQQAHIGNSEQVQKVIDRNMTVRIVAFQDTSYKRTTAVFELPFTKETLVHTGASESVVYCAVESATTGAYMQVYADPDAYEADGEIVVTNGAEVSVPSGYTVARIYASIF